MKNFLDETRILTVSGGAEIFECIQEALEIAVANLTKVQFIHNDTLYIADYKAIHRIVHEGGKPNHKENNL